MSLLPADPSAFFLELAPLFAVALLISATGFLRVYWFVSLGYAFSIVAMGALTALRMRAELSGGAALQLALLMAYGLRLGSFLLLRERSPAYRTELAEVEARNRAMPFGVKVAIWIGVALLYVAMFSPALFVLRAPGAGASAWLWTGVVIMAGGLTLESWADRQKSAAKRHAPARFCDRGLYRLVRCPNYLGEMIFWSGAFLSGAAGYGTLLHWLIAAAGLLCIQLVMLGSTRRLELKQEARYGGDPAFQCYVREVPVLIPFVPLYSLKRLRIYLG